MNVTEVKSHPIWAAAKEIEQKLYYELMKQTALQLCWIMASFTAMKPNKLFLSTFTIDT